MRARRPRSRLRGALLAAFAVGVFLTGVVLGLRHRAWRSLERQCSERVRGRCVVERLSLRVRGVTLRGVRVRALEPPARASLGRVDLDFSWWAALRGQRALAVTVDAGTVDLGGTLEAWRRRTRPEGPRTSRGRSVTLTRVTVGSVSGRARVALPEGTAEVVFRGLGGAWAPSGARRWRLESASLQWATLLQGTFETCVLDAEESARAVDCASLTGSADLALREALPALREALRGSPGEAEGAAPAAPRAGPWRVSLPRGSLILRRDGHELLHLDPTALELRGEGRRVSSAELRVGTLEAVGQQVLATWSHEGDRGTLRLRARELPLSTLAPWSPFVPWHDPSRGVARVDLELRVPDDLGVFEARGSASLEGVGFAHSRLAREPVDGLDLDLRGTVLWDRVRRRVGVPELLVRVNGVPAQLRGAVEAPEDHLAVDLVAVMPTLECDLLRRSFPATVSGVLSDFSFAGTLGAEVRLQTDSRNLPATAFDFTVRDGCAVLRASPSLSLARFSGPFVQRATEPGGVVRAFVTGPGSPAWVPGALLPPHLLNAVITREDGGFYRHHGFSPDEVRGALVRNLSAGRFMLGASTITMQLVKNVFLAREKTLVRKLQEVVLTWWLEQNLDKFSILELYLNVVEFGPGIYGVGPASRYFFGREPSALNALQSAYLALLLPAPIPRFQWFERRQLPAEVAYRLQAVLRTMVAAGRLSAEEVTRAQGEGLQLRARRTEPPAPQTMVVDPATTDAQAEALVAQNPFMQVREAPPEEAPTEPQAPLNTRYPDSPSRK
ncbi:MAG: transglycosylase domain-containing protein [Deltaproteobacteria bacterium]|nr:transglycosylase domain-containing protein [Deltaproteobacteria bacterium]